VNVFPAHPLWPSDSSDLNPVAYYVQLHSNELTGPVISLITVGRLHTVQSQCEFCFPQCI